MADCRFGRAHGNASSGIAQHARDRTKLDLVAKWGGGAVGIDVVNLARADPGALDSGLHAAETAIAVFGRRGDVVSIAGEAVANDFAVDLGATGLSPLIVFQHDNAGAFTHHKAITILVVGARGGFGPVIEAGGERAAGSKAGQRQAVDAAFSAAGDHDVSIAQGDQPGGIANGVGAGGTGGNDGMIGALEPKANRHMTRGQVDQATGDEEGADATRPLFMQNDRGVVNAADATNARADQDACAFLIFLGPGLNAGILNSLGCRRHRIDDEWVNLALFLDVHPLIWIVLAIGVVAEGQAMSDLTGDIVHLELVNAPGTTFAGQNIGPSGFNSATEGRYKPHPGDDNATQFHGELSLLAASQQLW